MTDSLRLTSGSVGFRWRRRFGSVGSLNSAFFSGELDDPFLKWRFTLSWACPCVFSQLTMQISKSVQACTQHACVILSAGKFIALFDAVSFLTGVKRIAKCGVNVKFSRLAVVS
jgi:hypothetical protein